MPRHDAFGNPVEEATAATPGLPGMPDAPPPPERRPAGKPAGRKRRGPIIAAVLVCVVALNALLAIFSAPPDGPSRATSAPSPSTPPSSAPAHSPEAREPDASLFTRSVLARALRGLRAKNYDRISFAAIKPAEMSLTVRGRADRADLVVVESPGGPDLLTSRPVRETDEFFPFSKLDPAVPGRLVDHVVADGRTLSEVETLTVTSNDGQPQWQAQMTDDSVYFADGAGAITDQLP